MRAQIAKAVNGKRTKILLDTGANVPAVNKEFATKLQLKLFVSKDKNIDV